LDRATAARTKSPRRRRGDAPEGPRMSSRRVVGPWTRHLPPGSDDLELPHRGTLLAPRDTPASAPRPHPLGWPIAHGCPFVTLGSPDLTPHVWRWGRSASAGAIDAGTSIMVAKGRHRRRGKSSRGESGGKHRRHRRRDHQPPAEVEASAALHGDAPSARTHRMPGACAGFRVNSLGRRLMLRATGAARPRHPGDRYETAPPADRPKASKRPPDSLSRSASREVKTSSRAAFRSR
jgi:hypothetical protein